MLTEKQIIEIKEHLEMAQNPVFFFDNDQDGLCSFILLQRYIGRGRGVPIKTFPELSVDYFRKINELNADYIFILDKPVVSKEFFDEVSQVNIPVVWIDHHEVDKKTIPEFVNYYNPLYNDLKSNEPTTDLCYQVTKRKEDLWIAIVGCISDKFFPKYYSDFAKEYPELSIKSKDAFEIFYDSEIGRVARIFGFALKDRITNVVSMLKFLMKVKNPYEVLEENGSNYFMHKRFNELYPRYKKFLERAKEVGNFLDKKNKILFFEYGGDLSISSDLSNELSYRFSDKIIFVIYLAGAKANISARGKKIRDVVLKAIDGLEGATGGGHEDAVGAKVNLGDLEEFKKRVKEIVG